MYRLNDEQQRIAATAAAVADREIAPRAADVDREAAFPKESIAALGASGLLGLTVPTAHGGLGQGPRTAAAVIDALAQRRRLLRRRCSMRQRPDAISRPLPSARRDRAATSGRR